MNRLLIIRLSALGDVAMTVPAIYSLAEQYPELHIDVLTRPFFAGLFINAPSNVHILTADFKSEYRGVRGMWRLLRRLSQLRPDGVADLHNVLRSWVIDVWFRMLGVKVAMVDKNRRERRKLFSEKAAQKNFVERYADVFASLGLPVKVGFVSLYERREAEPPFEPKQPAAGIAPFARYANKSYPLDKMHRTVELLSEAGVNVYLFGARGAEAEKMQAWADGTANCHSVAGRYPLAGEVALMQRMKVMVSMDSANHHLASLAGTPVVSIWGSTTPACGFMGYGQAAENAVCLGLECQPCSVAGAPECPLGHMACMNGIDPQEIARKVLDIIEKQTND